MTAAERDTAVLTIDLAAIADNWRGLAGRLGPGTACAGVVKADAYGCGARAVVPVLAAAGCRTFFVAEIAEALALSDLVPAGGRLFVLSGPPPGAAAEVRAAGLVPVLNSPEQVAEWATEARRRGGPAPCALHVDTGMTRLGLDLCDLRALAEDTDTLAALAPVLLMSHLACADAPDHPMNDHQRMVFAQAARLMPGLPTSLANSAGITLGSAWHGALVRPGIALYGGNPTPHRPNPMRQGVRLQAKILQIRSIDTPRTVGYGASHTSGPGRRLATVGVGYADGYPRAAGNRALAWVPDPAAGEGTRAGAGGAPGAACPGGSEAGWAVPVVGRVSMDLITLDVTAVPEPFVRPGSMIDLLGPRCDIDALAAAADTIGYEILTGLGVRDRVPRRLLGAVPPPQGEAAP